MTPLSGDQFGLRAWPYRATATAVGGGLRELTYDGRPVLDGYDADELAEGARGQLLIPWPNRVDQGRYSFAGEERQLDLTEPDRMCAIHGLTRFAEWRPAEHTDSRLVLTHRLHGHQGYPHVLDLRAEWSLDETTGVTLRLTAANVGSTTAPYANGAHPYLTVGTPTIDDCVLSLPAGRRLDTDERGIPTELVDVEDTAYDFREPRRLGATRIDYAFTGLSRDGEGRAWVGLTDPATGVGAALWVDETYPWVEVFTGDHLPDRQREGLGVEPMTCPPNGFASGTDLLVLQPGDQHTSSWGIVAR